MMTEGEPLRKAVEAGQLRGKSSAMAHTLIETAKLDGVDPQARLTDVLAATGFQARSCIFAWQSC